MTEPAVAITSDDLALEADPAARPAPPKDDDDDVLHDPEDDLLPPPKPIGSVTPVVTTVTTRG